MLQRLILPSISPRPPPPPPRRPAALERTDWNLQQKEEGRLPGRGSFLSKSSKVVVLSSPSPADERTVAGGGSETDGVLLLPNAVRRARDLSWSSGFSLGVDLGSSRTGLALGKGLIPPRPLIVLETRGQKLETRIMEIAEHEEVDEFIVGLPRSYDGKETPQSNKVRSIAGRLAVRAAESGWRVYLQDEHGTTAEALDYMIDAGLRRSDRQRKIDSYSAVMVLERYFSTKGHGAELVLPRKLELQDKLRRGPRTNDDA